MRFLNPDPAFAYVRAYRRQSSPASTLAVALVLALTACAKKDLKTEMDRARSWTATTKLAREHLGVGATNEAVTRQLLQRAVRAHRNEEREFVRLAKSDSQRAAARGLLDSLQEGIAGLQQVVR